MRTLQAPVFLDAGHQLMNYNCGNHIFNISSIKEFYKSVDSKGFAIKYVVAGKEKYTINRDVYDINEGEYLLINGKVNGCVEIDSKENVQGICISVDQGMISEVIASFLRSDTAVADPQLAKFFEQEHFLEQKQHIKHTQLGGLLHQLQSAIKQNNLMVESINKELFYQLSERVVTDQRTIYKQLWAIPALKPVTQKALYKQLLQAKDFMDTHFCEPIGIEQMAAQAAMSEFHFIRMFKLSFGSAPYQYLLSKRLHLAHNLLQSGCGISQVALDCGFADLFSFSKAFKKYFGAAPTILFKN